MVQPRLSVVRRRNTTNDTIIATPSNPNRWNNLYTAGRALTLIASGDEDAASRLLANPFEPIQRSRSSLVAIVSSKEVSTDNDHTDEKPVQPVSSISLPARISPERA